MFTITLHVPLENISNFCDFNGRTFLFISDFYKTQKLVSFLGVSFSLIQSHAESYFKILFGYFHHHGHGYH